MKFLFLLFVSVYPIFCFQITHAQNEKIVANPMDLNYRFQYNEKEHPSYREAADPVCEYFKEKYYLFASKSGGYWSSPDLAEWTYIPCSSIAELNNYAPTILVRNDSLYFMASNSKIYRTDNPDLDNWHPVNTQFNLGVTDPAFFQDDDGKVYIYWGCSDKNPIMGVEVDPKNGFKPIGNPVTLIEHHSDRYGWEVSGDNNEQNKDGWNEGPCMIKYKGKYYLQYAAPGTQFRVYADGIYVGEHPLGPFAYVENNPFSFKPGGFIGGAGHGHTFRDKYGNYWHVASMKISQRHLFERRLGLFPLFVTGEGLFHQYSVWTDYPFRIPNGKINFETNNLSAGWNLLSYNKPVTTSSALTGFPATNAVNEQTENWWSAQTGRSGEWLQIDLKGTVTIRAVQVNFADQDFTIRAPHPLFNYQYRIETSINGKDWKSVIDKTKNLRDAVHELNVLEKPIKARYLRITNTLDLPGKFSLYGLRVFGNGNGKLPKKITGLKVKRNTNDPRRYSLFWDKQEAADGYIIHTGTEKDRLLNEIMVHSNQYEGGFFNRDSKNYFSIDAFNENGLTKGTIIYEEN